MLQARPKVVIMKQRDLVSVVLTERGLWVPTPDERLVPDRRKHCSQLLALAHTD